MGEVGGMLRLVEPFGRKRNLRDGVQVPLKDLKHLGSVRSHSMGVSDLLIVLSGSS